MQNLRPPPGLALLRPSTSSTRPSPVSYYVSFHSRPRSPPHSSFLILALTRSLSNAVFAFLLAPPPPPHPPSSQLLFVSAWLAPVDTQACMLLRVGEPCMCVCVCVYELSSLSA